MEGEDGEGGGGVGVATKLLQICFHAYNIDSASVINLNRLLIFDQVAFCFFFCSQRIALQYCSTVRIYNGQFKW